MEFSETGVSRWGWDRFQLSSAQVLGAIVVLHGLVWTLGPASLIGNFHTDTLEAIYWGTDWSLGYQKHPPLLSWILASVLRLTGGHFPIFAELLVSQAMIAIGCVYVWRTARRYADQSVAILAAFILLVSPVGSIFAVQINHNSALIPFWAATQYYALAYLEERRLSDAVWLGVAAGLGLLLKYELAFLILPLGLASFFVPRWQRVWREPATALSVLIVCLILLPHVVWLSSHDWPSVQRAMGVQRTSNFGRFLTSLANLIAGQLILWVMPVLICGFGFGWRQFAARCMASENPHFRLAILLILGPAAALVFGDLVTLQIAKPLWSLPLMPSVALGFALLMPAEAIPRPSRSAIVASTSMFALWLIYLFGAGAVGQPLIFYAPDTSRLAGEVKAVTAAQGGVEPACLVVTERRLGPSYLLWASRLPMIVDMSTGAWREADRIEACRRVGGIVISAIGEPEATPTAVTDETFPRICHLSTRKLIIPGGFRPWPSAWPVQISYFPPEGVACGTS